MKYYRYDGVFYAFQVSPPLIYKMQNNFQEFTATEIASMNPMPIVNQRNINSPSTWPGDTSMLGGDYEPEPDEYSDGPELSPLGVGNPEQSEEANLAKDFNQRYAETFVLAQEVGEQSVITDPEVVKVLQIGSSTTPNSFGSVAFTKDGKKTWVTPLENFKIIQGIPSNKLINSEWNYVVEYSRMPDRQWKRGVCSSTFHAYHPSRWDREALVQSFKGTQYIIKSAKEKGFTSLAGNPDRSYSFLNMKELFLPKYPTYDKAIELLNTGTNYSVAITEKVYVSHSPRTKNYVIAIGSSKVGEIPPNKPDTIIIKEKLLQQEVLDLVKRNHLNAKVVE